MYRIRMPNSFKTGQEAEVKAYRHVTQETLKQCENEMFSRYFVLKETVHTI